MSLVIAMLEHGAYVMCSVLRGVWVWGKGDEVLLSLNVFDSLILQYMWTSYYEQYFVMIF